MQSNAENKKELQGKRGWADDDEDDDAEDDVELGGATQNAAKEAGKGEQKEAVEEQSAAA